MGTYSLSVARGGEPKIDPHFVIDIQSILRQRMRKSFHDAIR